MTPHTRFIYTVIAVTCITLFLILTTYAVGSMLMM